MNSNTAICKRLACGDSLKVAQNAKLKTLPNSSGLKLPRLFLFPLISTFNLITIFFFWHPTTRLSKKDQITKIGEYCLRLKWVVNVAHIGSPMNQWSECPLRKSLFTVGGKTMKEYYRCFIPSERSQLLDQKRNFFERVYSFASKIKLKTLTVT